jgi:hypothetical protein
MYRDVQRCGNPTFVQLTRAREYTRRMREQGELRGSRLAKVADFFKRYPIEGANRGQSSARHFGAPAGSETGSGTVSIWAE